MAKIIQHLRNIQFLAVFATAAASLTGCSSVEYADKTAG